MIDPSIWTDEGFLELGVFAKLFFIGLISHADDHGRGLASERTLLARIFPATELPPGGVRSLKDEVAKHMGVAFYAGEEDSQYYALSHWKRYQKVDRPADSIIPSPRHSSNDRRTIVERSPNDRRTVATNRIEVKRRQENEEKPEEDTVVEPYSEGHRVLVDPERVARPKSRTEITEPTPGPLSGAVASVLAKTKTSEEEPPRSFEERTAPARSATAPGRNRREDQLRCPTLLAGGERCNRMLAWSETRGGYYFCKRSGSNGCGADYHLADGWCVEGGTWTNGPNGRYNVGGVLKRNGAPPRETPDTEALDEIRALEADRAAHPEKYGVPGDLADPFGGET
jgi:hypothetical protein